MTAQDPAAGALVAFADQVTLTVTDLVIVPGLGGLTVPQARQRLADAGLELAAPASGFVVTQKPLQGTLVERGSTVSVTVSPVRVVPSVVGLTLAAARQVLEREKLPLDVPKGTGDLEEVTGQRPIAGTAIVDGLVVSLTFAGKVRVPDVVGKGLRAARSALEARDLVMVTDASSGSVDTQDPPAGTRVAAGSSVTVTVDDDELLVPNVLGMTEEQARRSVTAVDLVLRVVDGSGRVVAQDPAGLSPAAVGDVVSVTLQETGPPVEDDDPWWDQLVSFHPGGRGTGGLVAAVLVFAAGALARSEVRRRRVRRFLTQAVTVTARGRTEMVAVTELPDIGRWQLHVRASSTIRRVR